MTHTGPAHFYNADEDWHGWTWFCKWPSRATGYSRWKLVAGLKATWNSLFQAIFGVRNHPKWYWWH